MILSMKTLVNNKSVFQAALKSRSMDRTVKHTHKKRVISKAQAFNFPKKAEKSLGNTMTVNFDVNRKECDEENGSRLADVLLERL